VFTFNSSCVLLFSNKLKFVLFIILFLFFLYHKKIDIKTTLLYNCVGVRAIFLFIFLFFFLFFFSFSFFCFIFFLFLDLVFTFAHLFISVLSFSYFIILELIKYLRLLYDEEYLIYSGLLRFFFSFVLHCFVFVFVLFYSCSFHLLLFYKFVNFFFWMKDPKERKRDRGS